MRRPRAVISFAVIVVALALTLAACGGSDDEERTTTTSPSVEIPSPPPSSDLGALPPGFVECMADRGYEIDSPDDIHAAPPEVLQACFGSSH